MFSCSTKIVDPSTKYFSVEYAFSLDDILMIESCYKR